MINISNLFNSEMKSEPKTRQNEERTSSAFESMLMNTLRRNDEISSPVITESKGYNQSDSSITGSRDSFSTEKTENKIHDNEDATSSKEENEENGEKSSSRHHLSIAIGAEAVSSITRATDSDAKKKAVSLHDKSNRKENTEKNGKLTKKNPSDVHKLGSAAALAQSAAGTILRFAGNANHIRTGESAAHNSAHKNSGLIAKKHNTDDALNKEKNNLLIGSIGGKALALLDKTRKTAVSKHSAAKEPFEPKLEILTGGKHSKKAVVTAKQMHTQQNALPVEGQSQKLSDNQISELNHQKESSLSDKKHDSSSRDNFSFDSHASRIKKDSALAKDRTGNGKISFSDQIREIIDNARVNVRDGRNAIMNIKLNPEHLGKMNVKLGLENGVLSAKFVVDNADAKELLMGNMDQILESLSKEGLSLGNFHVDVRGESQQQQHSHEPILVTAPRLQEEEAVTSYEVQEMTHNGEINLIV